GDGMQDEAGERLGLVPLRPFPVVPHRVAVERVVDGRCGEAPQGLDVTDVVAALLAALRAVAGGAGRAPEARVGPGSVRHWLPPCVVGEGCGSAQRAQPRAVVPALQPALEAAVAGPGPYEVDADPGLRHHGEQPGS